MSDPQFPPAHLPSGYRLVKKRAWYRKKRFVLPLGLLALIAVMVGATGQGKEGGAQASGSASSASKGGAATRVGLGRPAADGKFRFVVTSFKCGLSKVGNEYLSQTAQGQFCVANLSVTNIGDEPQTFLADNQRAYVGKTEYTSDSEAATYYASQQGRDGGDWIRDINPGNTLKGSVLFDVPQGAGPDHLVLHDSAFSNGVTVTLK